MKTLKVEPRKFGIVNKFKDLIKSITGRANTDLHKMEDTSIRINRPMKNRLERGSIDYKAQDLKKSILEDYSNIITNQPYIKLTPVQNLENNSVPHQSDSWSETIQRTTNNTGLGLTDKISVPTSARSVPKEKPIRKSRGRKKSVEARNECATKESPVTSDDLYTPKILNLKQRKIFSDSEDEFVEYQKYHRVKKKSWKRIDNKKNIAKNLERSFDDCSSNEEYIDIIKSKLKQKSFAASTDITSNDKVTAISNNVGQNLKGNSHVEINSNKKKIKLKKNGKTNKGKNESVKNFKYSLKKFVKRPEGPRKKITADIKENSQENVNTKAFLNVEPSNSRVLFSADRKEQGHVKSKNSRKKSCKQSSFSLNGTLLEREYSNETSIKFQPKNECTSPSCNLNSATGNDSITSFFPKSKRLNVSSRNKSSTNINLSSENQIEQSITSSNHISENNTIKSKSRAKPIIIEDSILPQNTVHIITRKPEKSLNTNGNNTMNNIDKIIESVVHPFGQENTELLPDPNDRESDSISFPMADFNTDLCGWFTANIESFNNNNLGLSDKPDFDLGKLGNIEEPQDTNFLLEGPPLLSKTDYEFASKAINDCIPLNKKDFSQSEDIQTFFDELNSLTNPPYHEGEKVTLHSGNDIHDDATVLETNLIQQCKTESILNLKTHCLGFNLKDELAEDCNNIHKSWNKSSSIVIDQEQSNEQNTPGIVDAVVGKVVEKYNVLDNMTEIWNESSSNIVNRRYVDKENSLKVNNPISTTVMEKCNNFPVNYTTSWEESFSTNFNRGCVVKQYAPENNKVAIELFNGNKLNEVFVETFETSCDVINKVPLASKLKDLNQKKRKLANAANANKTPEKKMRRSQPKSKKSTLKQKEKIDSPNMVSSLTNVLCKSFTHNLPELPGISGEPQVKGVVETSNVVNEPTPMKPCIPKDVKNQIQPKKSIWERLGTRRSPTGVYEKRSAFLSLSENGTIREDKILVFGTITEPDDIDTSGINSTPSRLSISTMQTPPRIVPQIDKCKSEKVENNDDDDDNDDCISLFTSISLSDEEISSPRHRRFTSERNAEKDESISQGGKGKVVVRENRIISNNQRIRLSRNNVSYDHETPKTALPAAPIAAVKKDIAFSQNDREFDEYVRKNEAQFEQDFELYRTNDTDASVKFDSISPPKLTVYSNDIFTPPAPPSRCMPLLAIQKPTPQTSIQSRMGPFHRTDRSPHPFFHKKCFLYLRRGTCTKHPCFFNHSIVSLMMEFKHKSSEELMPIIDYAIQCRFGHLLSAICDELLHIFNFNDSIEIFRKLYENNLARKPVISKIIYSFIKKEITAKVIIEAFCGIIDKTDPITVKAILAAVKEQIEFGYCWETIGILCTDVSPPVDLIEKILRQCIARKKSTNHIKEVYNLLTKIVPSADADIVDNRLKQQFYEVCQTHGINNTENKLNTNPVAFRGPTSPEMDECIASPESEICAASPSHETEEVSKTVVDGSENMEEKIPIENESWKCSSGLRDPRSKIKEELYSQVYEVSQVAKKESTLNSAQYCLHIIDDLKEPTCAEEGKERFWKFYGHLDLIKKGLTYEDYDYVWELISKLTITEEENVLLTRALYQIVSREINRSTKHISEIVKRAVRAPSILSKVLFDVGMYTLIELINKGYWVTAYQLLKIVRIYEAQDNISFLLLSAEIYIANKRPLKAFSMLKQSNVFKSHPNDWSIKNSKPEDATIRHKIIEILLHALIVDSVDTAFYLFEFLLCDQPTPTKPIDLTRCTDALLYSLLKNNQSELSISLCRTIFLQDLTFLHHSTYQFAITWLLNNDSTMAHQLFGYATNIGVYNKVSSDPFTWIRVSCNNTEEEMYLIANSVIDHLMMNLGIGISRLRENQLSVYMIFEDVPDSRRLCHNDYGFRTKDNNLERSKSLMINVLQTRFSPSIKMTVAKKSQGRIFKIQSKSLVNYLQCRCAND